MNAASTDPHARGLEEMFEALLLEKDADVVLERLAAVTGQTLGVDRSLIFEVRLDTEEAAALCEWLNPNVDVAPTKATYPLSLFAGGDGQMRSTRTWIEGHADSPNPAMVADGSADVLHGSMSIQSLLWYPFGFRETRYYVLVFNQVVAKRTWLPSEIDFVRAATRQVTLALKQVALMEERARAERALLEAKKLETIRVLAGGVAHDLGSHLGIVLTSIARARREMSPTSPLLAILREAEVAALEASALSKQLVAYSGKGQFVVEPVDLRALVERQRSLLRSAARGVPIAFDIGESPQWIAADATQMRQILMNLVINAVEAIDGGSGSIHVRVGGSDVVLLEVRDTGPGIPAEVQSRIFEPFYSTKGPGRGLGLAAVSGIVDAHRGQLEVQSAPEAGTTVRVRFARIDGGGRAASTSDVVPAGALTGRVVLADDMENFRRTTAGLLEDMGLEVVSVSNGTDAVKVLGDADLLVMDWMMPPGGLETVRLAREISPGIGIIVMSGYASEAMSVARDEHTTFLEKPFRLEELEAALRMVLARSSRPAKPA
ncbi:MAG: response regulator [Deltaproteobacteria bacterium]|nr:response regulator [Deltaproteobacteria bacterium]